MDILLKSFLILLCAIIQRQLQLYREKHNIYYTKIYYNDIKKLIKRVVITNCCKFLGLAILGVMLIIEYPISNPDGTLNLIHNSDLSYWTFFVFMPLFIILNFILFDHSSELKEYAIKIKVYYSIGSAIFSGVLLYGGIEDKAELAIFFGISLALFDCIDAIEEKNLKGRIKLK